MGWGNKDKSGWRMTGLCVIQVKTLVVDFYRSHVSIGRINTLFSLFHQDKKEIHDAVQSWGIRNLTDFRQHAQYYAFQPVDPAKFQPPGMPATCRYYGSQQIGELTETNWSRRLTEQTTLRRCLYALRVLLSGNRWYSFDSAFFSRCASICLITAEFSILARACPVIGAQPMSESNALAVANALGITLTPPPHVSQVVISMLTMQVQRSTTSSTEITVRFQLLNIFARCLTLCYI